MQASRMNMKKLGVLLILFLLVLIIFIVGCAKEIKEEPKTEVQKEQPVAQPQEGTEVGKINETTEAQETETEETQKSEILEEKPKETQTNWLAFHGSNARTGFSESKAPSKPTVLWKWTVGDFEQIGYDGNFEANWPIIDNGMVFIAPEDIFALDLKTGKKIWSYAGEIRKFFPRGLAAGKGKLFASVNAGDNLDNLPAGFVYALDAGTGEFLWKYQTQKGISHSLPLFAENKLFVGDDSGTIYALDEAHGNLIWKKYLEDAEVVHSSPAYSDGKIFVGTEGSQRSNANPSHLYALDAETGKELWRFKVDYIQGKLNLIHSTPAVLEDVVYVGSENGYFYALDANDGSLIWKNKIASGTGELIGVSAAAALGYGKVFIGTYEGKFFALDQKDGKVMWKYDFGKANADSSSVLADNKVYFGVGEGGDGYFYSFNAENGDIVWKEKLGGSSAALANGILIVPNRLVEDNFKPSTPAIIAFSDGGEESLWHENTWQ
ncbi:MAG TPA: PQQ-binding-like beta-propeller repeat protein [Candidatus Nanoarchaeia archaeon]|nr:PQQ-binding-like beta-propeller repeat protein [Candidatus Nanoarchaeia archaeon]